MAENLPVNFVIPGENILASYDWVDIANGTGVQTFYFAVTKTSAATNYILTENSNIRSALREVKNLGATNFILSAFNTPRTIGGTAYFNATGLIDFYPGTVNFKITIKKNSTAITSQISSQAYAETDGQMVCLVPISIPEVNYAIGDVLSVEVEFGTSGNDRYFGVDPSNRDGSSITAAGGGFTQTKILIPFKINL